MTYKYVEGKTLQVLGESEEQFKEWKRKDLTVDQFNMIKRLTNLEGKKVLDFGCFHGMLTEMINKEKKAKCTGVDINFIGKPPKNCKRYDGKHIPFPEKSFDLVILIEVVEHLEDIDGIFREINRVLKKEGEVILTTPNKYSVSLVKKDHRHWKNQIKQVLRLKSRECIRMYSSRGLKKLAKKHGFTLQMYGRFRKLPFLRRGFMVKLTKN